MADAGRYIAVDADESLQKFMQYGHPNREAFMALAGAVFAEAADAVTKHSLVLESLSSSD